jgi:hypothetical protein
MQFKKSTSPRAQSSATGRAFTLFFAQEVNVLWLLLLVVWRTLVPTDTRLESVTKPAFIRAGWSNETRTREEILRAKT